MLPPRDRAVLVAMRFLPYLCCSYQITIKNEGRLTIKLMER